MSFNNIQSVDISVDFITDKSLKSVNISDVPQFNLLQNRGRKLIWARKITSNLPWFKNIYVLVFAHLPQFRPFWGTKLVQIGQYTLEMIQTVNITDEKWYRSGTAIYSCFKWHSIQPYNAAPESTAPYMSICLLHISTTHGTNFIKHLKHSKPFPNTTNNV